MNNPVSITPSGFFGSGSDNIVSINNFMTDYELKKINNFIRNNKVWDKTETKYNENGTVIYEANYWDDRVITQHNLQKESPETLEIIFDLVTRLKIIVDDFFNVESLPTSPALARWLPGNYQHPHADKELHNGPDAGKPNEFPWYDLAGLFYINDDYEGGELYFPNQNIEFKPEPGSAHFFPGDMNYIHGVREVTSGIRYTIPFFWTILRHTGEKQP